MAFDDQFRLSAHAVITNANNEVLLLKATYGDYGWGLPGGSLEPNETVHEAVLRECQEELGAQIKILYMSGMYFHQKFNAHTCIFKAEIPANTELKLSSEHSEYRYFRLDELSPVQKRRVSDCLSFDGIVKSEKF